MPDDEKRPDHADAQLPRVPYLAGGPDPWVPREPVMNGTKLHAVLPPTNRRGRPPGRQPYRPPT